MTVKTRKPKVTVQKTDIVLGALEQKTPAAKASHVTCQVHNYYCF
ncbi:hypothetical protein Afil01_12640 [Actinorhabdospora filicis]|uniref:Uncharacterized protein n=1 Tax=Actinorhabdospora filicis TaxID=1785913 RepID=A0A9W6SII2_9ACTN|nr:hypothetical protein [Actinorhabdospora filicis]GLZ76457.1 hypothetical protein Afil01_12640 [Actinorhabdospora filicis]